MTGLISPAIRNKIFQRVWYTIQFLWPRYSGNPTELKSYYKRMYWQIRIARMFGIISIVLFGDSNSEIYREYRDAKRYKWIVIMLGVGGTTPQDWIKFLRDTTEGKKIYSMIKDIPVIIMNIGGNCVLQGKMATAEKSLKELRIMFPGSWNCLVPPIWVSWLAPTSEAKRNKLRMDVFEINEYIKKYWREKTIDLHTPFQDSNGNPYITILSDAVHYSQKTQDLIQKYIFTNIYYLEEPI